ncbi:hypothetical protein [Acetobacter sacchari]|uniref:hypothetical protein n=1 Tax=Acetobacter sacchari TaxID=2661687 RepID=UPI001A9ECA76|nr:hypothetical protein [Acetobacter sacchari]
MSGFSGASRRGGSSSETPEKRALTRSSSSASLTVTVVKPSGACSVFGYRDTGG